MRAQIFALFVAISLLAHGEDQLFHEVTGDKVRLRATPSVEGEVLASLHKGERLIYIEWGENEWVKVKSKESGLTGWMHSDYYSSWAVADVDMKGVAFGDIAAVKPTENKLVGRFAPGQPVTVIGGSKTYAAVTGEETSERNECAGQLLQETKLKMDGTADDEKVILGIVGKATLTRLTAEPIPDASLASTAATGLTKPIKEGDPIGDTLRVEKGYSIKAPAAPLALLLFADPKEPGAWQFKDKTLAIIYGNTYRTLHVSCLNAYECFTLEGELYLAMYYGACESDDYNKAVYRITEGKIQCVYMSWAFSC